MTPVNANASNAQAQDARKPIARASTRQFPAFQEKEGQRDARHRQRRKSSNGAKDSKMTLL